MRPWRHIVRVHFTDGTPPRRVTSQSINGAKKTAIRAERMTGNKSKQLRAGQAVDEGHAGTDGEYCPICKSKRNLFEDTPEENLA